jgi:hypothetical protein
VSGAQRGFSYLDHQVIVAYAEIGFLLERRVLLEVHIIQINRSTFSSSQHSQHSRILSLRSSCLKFRQKKVPEQKSVIPSMDCQLWGRVPRIEMERHLPVNSLLGILPDFHRQNSWTHAEKVDFVCLLEDFGGHGPGSLHQAEVALHEFVLARGIDLFQFFDDSISALTIPTDDDNVRSIRTVLGTVSSKRGRNACADA